MFYDNDYDYDNKITSFKNHRGKRKNQRYAWEKPSGDSKQNACFNVVQKWDINLQTQDVVTLYQYQNCSSKWGFDVVI